MTRSDLIVIRTFLNKFDAQMAKSALDAANIDAMVKADDAGGNETGLWLGGVRLLVRAEDAERAAEILDTSAHADRDV
jgi:hypothetical protein